MDWFEAENQRERRRFKSCYCWYEKGNEEGSECTMDSGVSEIGTNSRDSR